MNLSTLFVTLVQNADGQWEPGIGDPTFMGWFTVFAYGAAAWWCVRAFRHAHGRAPRLAQAWLVLAVMMGVFAINKQLDLQSWFTATLKEMALRDGWYQERRQHQALFIRAMVLVSTAFLAVAAWWWGKYVRHLWLAGLGAGFIALFVVIRAASFHHVDVFLSDGPAGIRMNWVLELGGIACVGIAARRFARTRVKPGRRGPTP